MIKRVKVYLTHEFEVDIPDELLDENNADEWALDGFIYDAFMDDESSWDAVEFDIREVRSR